MTITVLGAARIEAQEHPPDHTPTEAKGHAIFVGLTLKVAGPQGQGDLIDVGRGTVRIATPEGPAKVPIRALHEVQTRRESKMSPVIIAVSDTKAERTFSRANDPTRMALEQSTDMSYVREQKIGAAMSDLMHAERQVAVSEIDRQVVDNMKSEAQQNVENAFIDTSGSMFDTGSTVGATKRPDAAQSDAYAVSFLAAAPARVENAYAVLVLMVRLPGAPQPPVSHVSFKRLPALGVQPVALSIRCEGLPRGYTIDSHEIHFYLEGRELATTESDNSVVVTQQEAFQYLLIRHLLEHKHADLPPQVVSEFLPPDVRRNLPTAALSRSAEVRVSTAGRALTVKLDGAEPRHANSYLEALLREAFFFPALLNGEPVETETTILVSDLVR